MQIGKGKRFLSGRYDRSKTWFGGTARLTCHALCVALSVTLCTDLSVAASDQITFDIPAQSLASALETYSVATSREVLYNGKLAIGRQSTSVKGVFTPEVALQLLLEGTGVSSRYMADDAFVLVPNDTDGLPNSSASVASPVIAGYYGRIQASLKRAFCAKSRTRPGGYRVAVSFWIGSFGTVSRTELLGSTGDPDLDSAVDQTIRGLTIGAPPAGFSQPVTLIVTPEELGMTKDCQSQPDRAAP
jgi:TonB family protein